VEETTAHHPHPEHAEAAHVDELQALREFWQRNGIWITAVSAAVLLALIGTMFVRARARAGREAASMRYAEARTVTALEDLLNDHPSAPVAPLALLKLAKQYYDAGNYDMSLNVYERFLLEHPDHLMAGVAEVGRLHSLEAKGSLEEAARGFSEFAAANPGHFLTPQALLAQARCHMQLGDFAGARTAYEDLLARYPDSEWIEAGEDGIKEAERAAARAASAPAADTEAEAEPETAPATEADPEPMVEIAPEAEPDAPAEPAPEAEAAAESGPKTDSETP
jgi:predicted negative regulator of RcsB-dependent stress response